MDLAASKALGKVSPELARIQLLDLVAGAMVHHPEQAEALAQQMNLPGSLEDLLVMLGNMKPAALLNQFHYMNPDFDLQDLTPYDPQKPLLALQAVLSMVLESDRWQGMAV